MPAVPAPTSRCPGDACTPLFDVHAVPAPRHARCLRRQKPMPAALAPTTRCTGGACTLLFDVLAVPAPRHAGPAPTSRCPGGACTLLFDVHAVPAPRHARCLRRQKPMPAVPAPTSRCTGGACTLLFHVPAVPAPPNAAQAPQSLPAHPWRVLRWKKERNIKCVDMLIRQGVCCLWHPIPVDDKRVPE